MTAPRRITGHEDGYGLNDRLIITSDDRDPKAGNSAHHYAVHYAYESHDGIVADIQFQHGPREVPGSFAGVTSTALLAILIDHLEGFQTGDYKNRETAIALTHLETAMLWLRKRADDRARRGVLGTYKT